MRPWRAPGQALSQESRQHGLQTLPKRLGLLMALLILTPKLCWPGGNQGPPATMHGESVDRRRTQRLQREMTRFRFSGSSASRFKFSTSASRKGMGPPVSPTLYFPLRSAAKPFAS